MRFVQGFLFRLSLSLGTFAALLFVLLAVDYLVTWLKARRVKR